MFQNLDRPHQLYSTFDMPTRVQYEPDKENNIFYVQSITLPCIYLIICVQTLSINVNITLNVKSEAGFKLLARLYM